MISFKFAQDTEVNAVTVMKTLNQYNGSDVEISFNNKSYPITFLQASATGTARSDELSIEFVWDNIDEQVLEEVYNTLRNSINKQLRINIGPIEFQAKIANTTKFPPHTDLKEMVDSRFAISFNDVSNFSKLEATAYKKNSALIAIKIPENVYNIMVQNVEEFEKYKKTDPPHITISYLKNVKKDQRSKIVDIIKDVAKQFVAFDIKTQGSTKLSDSYVSLVDCPQINHFKEILDERLNEEVEPDIVSTDHPEYIPHVSFLSDKKLTEIPKVTPVAWSANFIWFNRDNYNKEIKLVQTEEAFQEKEASSKILNINELKEIGYILASELDKIEYNASAKKLRKIISTLQTQTISEKLHNISRLIAKEDLLHLSNKCQKVAETVDKTLDERIETAITPYVAPEKLDEALNAVIEALQTEDEGAEVDGMGPMMPGTDHHITTYVKAPQTQDILSKSPEFSKSLEFGKRNF